MRKQTKEHIEKKAEARRRGSWFDCEVCGQRFWRKPYAIKRGHNRFCSKMCYSKWQTGRSKDISNRRSYKGSGNPNWKGGITPENKAIRGSNEYQRWRQSVFKKDNWTCQECGKRSKKNQYLAIHAHHVKPFAVFPDLRFSIDNGQTLCVECHSEKAKGIDVYKFQKDGNNG